MVCYRGLVWFRVWSWVWSWALLGAVFAGCSHPEVPRDLTIEMTGEAFQWHLRYPGADRLFGTRGEVVALRHPHVPVGARVRIVLKSEDYVYLFMLPGQKNNHIAMPGRTFTVEFDATRPGLLKFSSGQMCGVFHPELEGVIVVEPPRAFFSWLARQQTTPPAANSVANSGSGQAPGRGRI